MSGVVKHVPRPSEAEVDAILAALSRLPPCTCEPDARITWWCPVHGRTGAVVGGRHRAEP